MGIIDKAAAMVRNDAVEEIAAIRGFYVQGENRKYRVTVIGQPDGTLRIDCPCKAGDEGIKCSHVLAVQYIVSRQKKVRKV
jgi:hypothetical protein